MHPPMEVRLTTIIVEDTSHDQALAKQHYIAVCYRNTGSDIFPAPYCSFCRNQLSITGGMVVWGGLAVKRSVRGQACHLSSRFVQDECTTDYFST